MPVSIQASAFNYAPVSFGPGTHRATASGALTNGGPVIVNADGTVSAVTGQLESITSVGGCSITANSTAFDIATNTLVVLGTWTSGYPAVQAATFNAANNTVTWGTPVVVVSNASRANFPAGVPGIVSLGNNTFATINWQPGSSTSAYAMTVSGTTITLGSAISVVGNSQDLVTSIAAHTPSGRFLLTQTTGTQTDKDLQVTAYSVTGTTISSVASLTIDVPSQGAVYSPGQTTYLLYSSNLNRFYLFYWPYLTGAYAQRYLNVYVLTYNGTNSITLSGGPFNATPAYPGVDTTDQSSLYLQIDNVNDRYFVSNYKNGSNYVQGAGGAVINGSLIYGSLTTTTVSQSSPYPAHGSGENSTITALWLDSANEMLLKFYGTSYYATISGNSILLSNTTLNVPSINNIRLGKDVGNAKYLGVATSAQWVNFSQSNATTENFIGFADNNYSNGQTATIQVAGLVDDAQTGLTAGQSYYLQDNGTIGLTPSTSLGTVFAGTAVSATKIIVKG